MSHFAGTYLYNISSGSTDLYNNLYNISQIFTIFQGRDLAVGGVEDAGEVHVARVPLRVPRLDLVIHLPEGGRQVCSVVVKMLREFVHITGIPTHPVSSCTAPGFRDKPDSPQVVQPVETETGLDDQPARGYPRRARISGS